MSLVKTNVTRMSCIKKALLDCGFKSHMLEISEKEKFPMKGYHGDIREQRCNLRIKGSGWGSQNYVGPASNDLGFERQADGTYAFHVSEYDSHKYGTTWQEKFLNLYSKHVTLEVAEETGFYVAEENIEEDGTILIRLQSSY